MLNILSKQSMFYESILSVNELEELNEHKKCEEKDLSKYYS